MSRYDSITIEKEICTEVEVTFECEDVEQFIRETDDSNRTGFFRYLLDYVEVAEHLEYDHIIDFIDLKKSEGDIETNANLREYLDTFLPKDVLTCDTESITADQIVERIATLPVADLRKVVGAVVNHPSLFAEKSS